MDSFNPDVYISEKTASDPSGGFNPDAYIAEKSPPYDPNAIDFEGSSQYPNHMMTDPGINDAMMVQGLGGLAKTGASLAIRGLGAGLDALPLTKNIAPTIENTSNDLLLKGMGARGAQVKAMGGLESARDAADVARQGGMDKVFSTEIGRKQALQNILQKNGQQIGNLRQAAGTASPDIFDQVEQDLMAKYNPVNQDVLSGQAPQVRNAINTVRNTANEAQPTNAGIAQGITALNRYATGAKQLQPVNALTDVANNLSKANDAEIAQKLGPEKALDYLKALKNESGGFKLTQPLERGAERVAVGGQNGGTLSNMAQKVKNMGGYRAASQGLHGLHGALTNPVDLSTLGPNALKVYLANEAEKENQ